MSVKTPSKLEKILSEGHFAVTSECGPPRGSNPDPIVEKAELIKDHVDAINITDNQTSMTRLCSLAACIRLKLNGQEPVLQMVTRDRNRIALQSDILGAASFDIHNMLCLSGDHQSFGDNPKGQNVHDIDSMQLIQMVRLMRDEGKFCFWAATTWTGPLKCLWGRPPIPLLIPLKFGYRDWPKK
jgi:methylenetetrahydrofolate reductase (NADPH)